MKTERSKNPLVNLKNLMKPTNLLKAFVVTTALTTRGAQGRDLLVSSRAPALTSGGNFKSPLLAPAPAPANPQAKAVDFDPTVLCFYAKPDACRLGQAKGICTDKFQGQGSFGQVEAALGEPYGGSLRPALAVKPNATYDETCEAVSEKLSKIEKYCVTGELNGPC